MITLHLIILFLLSQTQQNSQQILEAKTTETNNDTCENYETTKGIPFGLICEKSKNSIQKDPEIEITNNQQAAIGGVTFYTGLSSYPADRQQVAGKQIFTAQVDCDTSKGPIYRPTSTCLVGIHLLENRNFSYMNFVLEDHTMNSIYISHDEAIKIWLHQINKHTQTTPH